MRQLTYIKPGTFEWHDVPAPRLRSDRDAIVRPIAVARCDLDLYIANGLVRYPGPFAFGHETVAEIVEAGAAVGLSAGSKVIVPFQLSCGACDNCRRGWTNSCSSFPFGAAYGLKPTSGTEFGGALSDLMLVPFADHMLVRLPDGIDPVTAASVSDNVSDGWRAVAPFLKQRPGASVLVIGGLAQSVGLYAAAAAVALGAGRVLYLDDDIGRRNKAVTVGAVAEPLSLPDRRGPSERFEIVVEAAGDEAALGFAIGATAANGVLTSVSIHLAPKTAVPLTRAYYKGLTFHTGRVNSRTVLPDVIACIAGTCLHPGHITHRVVSFDEAPDAMTDPGPKVVFAHGKIG